MRMFPQGHSCHRWQRWGYVKGSVADGCIVHRYIMRFLMLNEQWVADRQTKRRLVNGCVRDVDWVTHVNPRWVWVRAWVEPCSSSCLRKSGSTVQYPCMLSNVHPLFIIVLECSPIAETLRSIFGVNRFLSVIDLYDVFEKTKKLLYTFFMNLLSINIKPPTNVFPYFVKVFMEAENVSLASEWPQ